MDLSNTVSETALATLMARVAESRRPEPLIVDPVGGELLGLLEERLEDEARRRILQRKLPRSLTAHLAIRGRQATRRD